MNRFIIMDDFEKESFHIFKSVTVITVGLLSFLREEFIVVSPPCINVIALLKSAHTFKKQKNISIVPSLRGSEH